ncbi:MAG: ABC transporter permease subunit, partial [Proteobacteria bacterium]
MKLLLILLVASFSHSAEGSLVRVGSKAFTEGYTLGELVAERLGEEPGARVERRFGMGATGILYAALNAGEIDLYPEYTGTIAEAILKRPDLKEPAAIRAALAPFGLTISPSLGFENNYALAVPETYAAKHGLRTITDLKKVANEVRSGFSHEFMSREDGYRPLVAKYGLKIANINAMDHALSYRGVASGAVDLLDVYSTDAKIKTLGLRVLEDDEKFFTRYEAVVLARLKFTEENPALWAAIESLKNSVSAPAMIALNEAVDERGLSFRAAVREFRKLPPEEQHFYADGARRIAVRTREHLELVGVSLFFSVLVGVPLGILAARHRRLGRGILAVSGLVQTIPSLALLCFLIPIFGIGLGSALVALFLYGLLPVVTSTYVGLISIEKNLLEVATVLGLSRWQSLVRVKLPLASRYIISGIRTSAVISIGTATLAALIGAGGYGAIIVAGLAINDTGMILLGAIPAAGMALLV